MLQIDASDFKIVEDFSSNNHGGNRPIRRLDDNRQRLRMNRPDRVLESGSDEWIPFLEYPLNHSRTLPTLEDYDRMER